MSRRFPPECKVTGIRGRNGACDVVLTVAVPHGTKTRDVEVPLEPTFVLALADAIRCCPEHILETHRTGKRGPGPEASLVNLGHAVWHLEHPDMPRPCLPDNGRIIDVMDETKLPAGPSICTACQGPIDENGECRCEECRTCLGTGRVRDGETRELRKRPDCRGAGMHITGPGAP